MAFGDLAVQPLQGRLRLAVLVGLDVYWRGGHVLGWRTLSVILIWCIGSGVVPFVPENSTLPLASGERRAKLGMILTVVRWNLSVRRLRVALASPIYRKLSPLVPDPRLPEAW